MSVYVIFPLHMTKRHTHRGTSYFISIRGDQSTCQVDWIYNPVWDIPMASLKKLFSEQEIYMRKEGSP